MRAMYFNLSTDPTVEGTPESLLTFTPPTDVDNRAVDWGKTRGFLWKSPFKSPTRSSPTDIQMKIYEDFHLRTPVSLTSYLIYFVNKNLHRLWLELEQRQKFMRQLRIHLFSRYYDTYHLVEIQIPEVEDKWDAIKSSLDMALLEVECDDPISKVSVEFVPSNRRRHRKCTQATFKVSCGIASEDEGATTIDVLPDLREPIPTSATLRPLELHELSQFKFIKAHPLRGRDTCAVNESRGRQYFAALTSEGDTVFIVYDLLENNYFLLEETA